MSKAHTHQEASMTSTTTVLILTDGDLADAFDGHLHEAHDQHGTWHNAPKLTKRQCQALDDGEVVEVDGAAVIAPRWPQNVRQHHLGDRPAERLAVSIGHDKSNPTIAAKIAEYRAQGLIA